VLHSAKVSQTLGKKRDSGSMGNRVWIIAFQTHTRLRNGWRFCLISIPMGTILSHTRILIEEFPTG
jgi:hypothetical protein